MSIQDIRAVLARIANLFLIAVSSLCLVLAPAAFAQDEDAGQAAVEAADEADDEETYTDEVIVTGSRVKRDTYSSVAPLQVITAQISREVGLIDAGDILQESSAAAAQQLDLTFSGFRTSVGPGAQTLDLRGLGEARTLILINGKRVAPAGVEGAPFAPDLNLIPASLVQQYDLLLDGASSVYGSDAIAGVANIILRKDFDGIELEAFSRVPEYDNGIDHTVSLVWGKNFDRGFIGIGAEAVTSERVAYKDRPWTDGCTKHWEITEDGEFRTEERYWNNVIGMDWDECRLNGTVSSRIIVPFAGSVYYTPGFQQSAGAWPEFSLPTRRGLGIDGDQDGQTDMSYRDYDPNGTVEDQNGDLFPEIKTQSFMAFGEYTFDGEANITPYFEVLYARRDFNTSDIEGQLFPEVPADNPYNICNPNQPNGIDCGLAMDAFLDSPGWVAQFQSLFLDFCLSIGVPQAACTPRTFGLTPGASGPAVTRPIVRVRGDRNNTDVVVDQTRVVAGVRGDMPFMNDIGSLDNWSFDIYASYSKSTGDSSRFGIRGDRLDYALGWFSSTSTPCEGDLAVSASEDAFNLQDDTAAGCVPVNMFAPSLYRPEREYEVGDFASVAERNYLFDSRDFDTDYEQTIISAYATGDVFSLPGGEAALVIGVETREDDINSMPDAVARDGLLWGFFKDGGAIGKRRTNEAFAELEMPLFGGYAGMRELTINASTRWTDDELYGSNWTQSFKLGYRPVDSLLIRATAGTAFRAPNLRELYLQPQSGFGGIFDPCFIPADALDELTGEYIPEQDDRDPIVLQNCIANGVDPTLASNNGFNSFSVEQSDGGSLTLDPEQSESWSAGFAWDQPFSNAFELSIGATYYEIEVKDTVIGPSGQFIVNDCYTSTTGNSVFCERIERDFSDPTFPRITELDRGFLNRDSEKARGVDVNIAFEDTMTLFERPIDITIDIRANRQLERSTLFVDDNGNEDFNEYHGEWGFPDWRAIGQFRFDYDDWRLTWETRFIGAAQQDPAGVDEFSDAFTRSDTCDGPPDDVLCRDYADFEDYYQHNVSVYYYGDRWTVGGGIRNVSDRNPLRVDETETLSFAYGIPRGFGYDLNGRTFFFNAGMAFGGGE